MSCISRAPHALPDRREYPADYDVMRQVLHEGDDAQDRVGHLPIRRRRWVLEVTPHAKFTREMRHVDGMPCP